MSKLPETKQELLTEKESWENIIHSSEWVVFRRWLAEHCDYLQKEANDHLRHQRNVEAYGSLRAMEDARKMLESVRIRLNEINKVIEKGA